MPTGIRKLAFVAAAVCWTLSVQAQHYRPFQRESDTYFRLLMQQRFEDIERAAVEARTSAKVISDGQPVLAVVYGGTAGCLTQGCRSDSDERWAARGQRLEEWVRLHPSSITARVALASFPIEDGWYARGGGYANTVTEEGWSLFRRRIEDGRLALERLDEAAKADAGWSFAMLEVGLAQRWPRERFEALYEKAARAHPYYIPIHFAASAYYAPRWYGSAAALRAFIERAAARTASRWGDTLYARLNWSLWSRSMFEDGQADWPRMKSGFDRILKDHPDPWNLNNYARFSCHAGDVKTMARLAEEIGDKPIVPAWYGDHRYYESCRTHARRMTR